MNFYTREKGLAIFVFTLISLFLAFCLVILKVEAKPLAAHKLYTNLAIEADTVSAEENSFFNFESLLLARLTAPSNLYNDVDFADNQKEYILLAAEYSRILAEEGLEAALAYIVNNNIVEQIAIAGPLAVVVAEIKSNDYKTAENILENYQSSLSEVDKLIVPNLYLWTSFAQGKVADPIKRLERGGNNVMLPFLLLQTALMADLSNKHTEAVKYYLAAMEQSGYNDHVVNLAANYFQRHNQVDLLAQLQALTGESYNSIGSVRSLIPNVQVAVAEMLSDFAAELIDNDLLDDADKYIQYSDYLNGSYAYNILLEGVIAKKRKDYDQAILFLENIKMEERYFPHAMIEKLEAYLAQGQSLKAVEIYQVLSDRVKKSVFIDFMLTLLSHKNYNLALQLLEEGNNLVEASEQWNISYLKAISFTQLGRWKEAELELQKSLSYAPEHNYLQCLLGYNWLMQGVNHEQANKYIKDAYFSAQDEAVFQVAMALVKFKNGEYDQALTLALHSYADMQEDINYHKLLGEIYIKLGNSVLAEKYWKLAQELENKIS